MYALLLHSYQKEKTRTSEREAAGAWGQGRGLVTSVRPRGMTEGRKGPL